MRIAVASEGLEVSPHFASYSSLMCYTVNRGVIVECQNMPNPGLPMNKLVPLLSELGISTFIVGAIEYDVANQLCGADIEVVAGARGSARVVVEAYLSRTLIGTDELCHADWDTEEDLNAVQA